MDSDPILVTPRTQNLYWVRDTATQTLEQRPKDHVRPK